MKHIVAQVFWNWMALACQIVVVFQVAGLLTLPLKDKTVAEMTSSIEKGGLIIIGAIIEILKFRAVSLYPSKNKKIRDQT